MYERVAGWIALACHQAGALCAVYEPDNTVMTQHERSRELADSGPALCVAAAHREQELMLRRG